MDQTIAFIKDHLTELQPLGERLHFRGGQVLFYAGHQPAGLFLLQHGTVVYTPDPSIQIPHHPPQNDQLIGVHHLLADTPYAVTGTADGDVEVLFIPKAAFTSFLKRNNQMQRSGASLLNLCAAFGVLLIGLCGPTMAFGQSGGQAIFQQRCAACHTTGGGRLVGPDLAGVQARRSTAWIKQFIRGSQAMVQQGDKDAVALFNEYNLIPMPDQPLNDAEMTAVLAYIKANSPSGGAATPAPAPAAPAVYTELEVARGKALYQGRERFQNEGPMCNACHHVRDDAVMGGGTMAKELTSVYSRMNDAGITAILQNPPFAVMQQAYKDAPLTEDEVRAVIAFLQYANKEHFYQQTKNYSARFVVTAAIGVAGLFGLFGLIWFRRGVKT